MGERRRTIYGFCYHNSTVSIIAFRDSSFFVYIYIPNGWFMNNNTKQQIAAVAFQLFVQHGYKATAISQLVSNSGLSKGAFYHHFKSKQAIYEYVIDYYFLSYYREFDWSLVESNSLENFLKLMTNMYSEFVSEIKSMTKNNISKYFILFFEAYNNMGIFKETVQYFYKKFKETLSKKYITEKKLSKEKGEEESMKIISKFEGMFFWFAVFPDEDINKYFNTLNNI